MKRDFYLIMTGFVSGIALSLYLYWKRKKIIQKLNDIESRVRNVQMKNMIRGIIFETTSNIRRLITNTKGVPQKEKEYILKKVEEKIRKLEEIV
ncbi:hypothetical protein [Persephonella sp.]